MKPKSSEKTIRICKNGHTFFKTSDCPVCPKCEQLRKPNSGFLTKLSAPSRRALENNGITTLKKLSRFSESQILALHGIGKSSIPKLLADLTNAGLSFRKESPEQK